MNDHLQRLGAEYLRRLSERDITLSVIFAHGRVLRSFCEYVEERGGGAAGTAIQDEMNRQRPVPRQRPAPERRPVLRRRRRRN